MNDRLPQLVAPLITWLFSLNFSVSELRLFVAGWQTRGWPTADATILHSEVRFSPIPRGALYYPSVIYRYVVGGTEYHGSHPGYTGRHFSSLSHNPWKPGQRVAASYDPESPSHAVLEAGVGIANYLGLTAGVVASALATWWLLSVLGAA